MRDSFLQILQYMTARQNTAIRPMSALEAQCWRRLTAHIHGGSQLNKESNNDI